MTVSDIAFGISCFALGFSASALLSQIMTNRALRDNLRSLRDRED
jgi:hypothetical protein